MIRQSIVAGMPKMADSEEQKYDGGSIQPDKMLADLEHRIHELEHTAEERFGEFNRVDWTLSIGGALVIPYLLYLWFWP
jgi:hypothetical protein